MKRILIGTILLLLTGCAGSFAGRAPETRTLTLPVAPPQAYQRTVATFVAMGAQLPPLHAVGQPLQAMVHGAVLLSVELEGQGTGTRVTVTASIPPGKLVIGTMTELDQFCARLTAQETAYGR
jgi:hypothetical protein